jgi:hypothetical protein
VIEYQPALEKTDGVQSVLDLSKSIRRKFIGNHAEKLWKKWESEVVSSAPTLTVSSKISEEMKMTFGNAQKIFVVPNFPLRTEFSSFT